MNEIAEIVFDDINIKKDGIQEVSKRVEYDDKS
jgi:hypothetical protein